MSAGGCTAISLATLQSCTEEEPNRSALIDFPKAVTKPTGAAIELRAMSKGAMIGRKICRTATEIIHFLSAYSTCDLYFGVATRRPDARNGKLESCLHLASLFADQDFKVTARQIAEAALYGFALTPNAY